MIEEDVFEKRMARAISELSIPLICIAIQVQCFLSMNVFIYIFELRFITCFGLSKDFRAFRILDILHVRSRKTVTFRVSVDIFCLVWIRRWIISKLYNTTCFVIHIWFGNIANMVFWLWIVDIISVLIKFLTVFGLGMMQILMFRRSSFLSQLMWK